MKRFTTLLWALVLVIAACGSTGSSSLVPTPSPAPATPTPAATIPAQVTSAPTATPAAIAAAVTFDGQKCTYAGPSVVPRGATVAFAMTNTPTALKGSVGAGLYVLPVVDGTTWDQILAETPGRKVSDIPKWAILPDVGINEVQILFPDAVARGERLTVEMTRNLYDVMCATAPNEGERGYPAILLNVLAK